MPSLSLDDALLATRFLVSISLLVQSLEYFSLRRPLSDIDGTLPKHVFWILVGVQMMSGLFFVPTLLFLSTLLISVHFRGTFNGGADTMSLVVLSALMIQSWFPENEKLTEAAIVYIGAQSFLSYLVAGLAKLRKLAWRSGAALKDYVLLSSYGFPKILHSLVQSRRMCVVLSWLLILFEVALLPALFFPKLLLVWMIMGLGFHVSNFAAIGLNRFVFAWIATYPGLIYLSERLRS